MRLFRYVLSKLFVAGLSVIPLHGANSLSYYGVTLNFEGEHSIGKWANGEPYIVAPSGVSITSIENPPVPPTATRKGGAMINPVPMGKQGYCSNYQGPYEKAGYDATLDVSLKYPFKLVAGDSLIVSKAIDDWDGVGNNYVESVVGFIVVAEAPPEGSFRPGLYGKDHRVRFNVTDIDWSVLKNLKSVPLAPTQAWIEADARLPALPWWEWGEEWSATFIRPFANCGAGDGGRFRSNYGRDIAFKWGYVALWLNLSHTREVKMKTMIQTIQCGIDLGSYFDNGGLIRASGGHQIGFKFPVLLASAALGFTRAPDLVAYAADDTRFIEDITTFYVQQSDVGRVVNLMPDGAYIQEDVGKADWGVMHRFGPEKDDRRWEGITTYRTIQWPAMVGTVLAADLMGLRSQWNHPATFDYTERFVKRNGLGGFEKNMWNTHKEKILSSPTGLRTKR